MTNIFCAMLIYWNFLSLLIWFHFSLLAFLSLLLSYSVCASVWPFLISLFIFLPFSCLIVFHSLWGFCFSLPRLLLSYSVFLLIWVFTYFCLRFSTLLLNCFSFSLRLLFYVSLYSSSLASFCLSYNLGLLFISLSIYLPYTCLIVFPSGCIFSYFSYHLLLFSYSVFLR